MLSVSSLGSKQKHDQFLKIITFNFVSRCPKFKLLQIALDNNLCLLVNVKLESFCNFVINLIFLKIKHYLLLIINFKFNLSAKCVFLSI